MPSRLASASLPPSPCANQESRFHQVPRCQDPALGHCRAFDVGSEVPALGFWELTPFIKTPVPVATSGHWSFFSALTSFTSEMGG